MNRGVAMLYLMSIVTVFTTVSTVLIKPANRIISNNEVIQIDTKLSLVTGGGGNSGLLVTDSAVVVIDTKMPSNAEELYKMAKEKAGNKKIIVINTHYHMDHTGGNRFYKGDKIYIGDYDKEFLKAQLKAEDMPTDFVKNELTLPLGDETIEIYNMGQAHTFSDLVVYLKNRKILFTGDLLFDKINPVIKRESGADIDKWINALKTILVKWDVKSYISGHGNLGGKEKINNLINYFEDMKTASSNPDKENQIIAKYSDWRVFPDLASPQLTIKYIKDSH